MFIELISGNRYVFDHRTFERRQPEEVDEALGEYLLDQTTRSGVPYFRELRGERADEVRAQLDAEPEKKAPPLRSRGESEKPASKKKAASKKTISRADREQRTEKQDESDDESESFDA